MFERFTRDARKVVERAVEEARALGHARVEGEHLLLALAQSGGGEVLRSLGADPPALRSAIAAGGADAERDDAKALASIGIDLEAVRERVEASFGPGALRRREKGGRQLFGRGAKRALELSLREALALSHNRILPEHVLLGLTRDPDPAAAAVLDRCGTSAAAVRSATLAALRTAA